MPKITVLRSKMYRTEVEAASVWEAMKTAEGLPGGAWQLDEDKVIGAVGLDGVLKRQSQPCKHNPEPEVEDA